MVLSATGSALMTAAQRLAAIGMAQSYMPCTGDQSMPAVSMETRSFSQRAGLTEKCAPPVDTSGQRYNSPIISSSSAIIVRMWPPAPSPGVRSGNSPTTTCSVFTVNGALPPSDLAMAVSLVTFPL